jgi:hypothetical protein
MQSGDPPPSSKSYVVAKPVKRGRSTIRDQKSVEVGEVHRISATEIDRISEAAAAAGMSPDEFRRLPRSRSRDDITQLGMQKQNQHERPTDPGGDPEEKGQTVRLGQLDVAAEIADALQTTPDMPTATEPPGSEEESLPPPEALPEPAPSLSPESEPTASEPGLDAQSEERQPPGSSEAAAALSLGPASIRRSALVWVIGAVLAIVLLVVILRAMSAPTAPAASPLPPPTPAAPTAAPTATVAETTAAPTTAPTATTTATATAATAPPPSWPSAPRSAWPSKAPPPPSDRPDIDWQ